MDYYVNHYRKDRPRRPLSCRTRARRTLTGSLLAALLLMSAVLPGCGHTHEYSPATCTEPETCVKCGETVGEALGHDFAPATCTEPETCSRCGETNGEALGHDFEGATLWDAAVCTRCGETGDRFLSAYETLNLPVFSDPDAMPAYETVCYSDPTQTTTGEVASSLISAFTSDDTHEAVEGYEYQTGTMYLYFWDDNALNQGFSFTTVASDYYTGTVFHMEEENTLTYRDAEYHPVITSDAEFLGWMEQQDDSLMAYVEIDFCALVPTGYDGLVINLLEDRADAYAYNVSEFSGKHTDLWYPDKALN